MGTQEKMVGVVGLEPTSIRCQKPAFCQLNYTPARGAAPDGEAGFQVLEPRPELECCSGARLSVEVDLESPLGRSLGCCLFGPHPSPGAHNTHCRIAGDEVAVARLAVDQHGGSLLPYHQSVKGLTLFHANHAKIETDVPQPGLNPAPGDPIQT